jgi:hypothetical protein
MVECVTVLTALALILVKKQNDNGHAAKAHGLFLAV